MNEDIFYELKDNNPSLTDEDIKNILVVVEMADELGELGEYDLENIEFYQSIIDACERFDIQILTLMKLLELRDEEFLFL